MCKVTSQSDDHDLIEQAYREQRVLLTEDKDFGWWVFVSHAESAGVLLIRFPGNARQTLAASVLQLVRDYADQVSQTFVVVEPGRIRFSRKSA